MSYTEAQMDQRLKDIADDAEGRINIFTGELVLFHRSQEADPVLKYFAEVSDKLRLTEINLQMAHATIAFMNQTLIDAPPSKLKDDLIHVVSIFNK